MTSAFPPGPGDGSAPPWLVRSAAIGGRLLVLGVLLWLLAGLAVKLTVLLVAVLVGLLLAGVAAPSVQWAERKGVPRAVGAAVAVLLLLGTLVGLAVGLGVRIAGELPRLREELSRMSEDLSQRFGVELPSFGSGGGSSVGELIGPARTVGEVLVAVFLALALCFLFLTSGPAMWRWLLGKFGGRVREDVDAGGRAAWTTVGTYVRGLTVVALFDAVGIGAGLLLLGVPLALTLAVLQFLASYVPTVGAVVAGALAVVVAYADGGAGTAGLVLALVLVVQQLGNDLVEPWVMQRRLPLNAAAVLVMVTAGGLLWGLPGALLFVPLAAAATAAAHELWVGHGRPPLLGGNPGPG